MTKTIDALVEALDAIVKSLADQDDEGMIEHAQQMIDARAALALALARAEQVQGPVAWMVYAGVLDKRPVYPAYNTKELAESAAACIKSDTEVRPLYTSPQPAKLEPLPEDELRTAFENWFSNQGEWPAAIERHANGPYLLAVTQSAWVAWFNAGAVLTAAHNAKLGVGT